MEPEIVRDKRRVLEHLRTARKFMPYLHVDMSAHSVVQLLGSRDRAQRALTALVQDGKIHYLENCSPDAYQAYADVPPPPPVVEPACDCTQGPDYEGPCSWCDVHGQPSAAYRQGLNEGRRQEREAVRAELAELERQRSAVLGFLDAVNREAERAGLEGTDR